MKELLNIVDINIVLQVAIMVGIYLFLRYGKGRVPASVYEDVKTALMLTGQVFRVDKIKALTDVALDVVNKTEVFNKTNEEKHEEAINEIAKELNKTYGIKVSDEVLDALVKVTVSYLPKTH